MVVVKTNKREVASSAYLRYDFKAAVCSPLLFAAERKFN